jgi:membrane protein DedA with SNARE-associated domain
MVFFGILDAVIQWSLAFVTAYGPYSVFLVVILEEILLPIPSPLVIMGAGFILIPPNIPLGEAITQVTLLIVIPASIASTIGSFFAYYIGYFGGKTAVMKFQRFLGFNWAEVEKAEKRFEDTNKTWVTIAILRAIPFFPIAVVSLTAGVLRLNKWKYALATFVGSVPRVFVLGMIGWSLGSAYVTFAEQLNVVEDVILVGIAVVIIYFLYRNRQRYAKHYKTVSGKISSTVRR